MSLEEVVRVCLRVVLLHGVCLRHDSMGIQPQNCRSMDWIGDEKHEGSLVSSS